MKRPTALLVMGSLLAGCMVPGGVDQVPTPRQDPRTAVIPPPGCHPVPFGSWQTVYDATFPNGSLLTGYSDIIHSTPQAMKSGDAGPLAQGSYGAGPATDGALALSLEAPKDIPKNQTPSVGVFVTDLPFGPAWMPSGPASLRSGPPSVFVARATFQKLDGKIFPPPSDDYSNAWAVGIAARTGDEHDLVTETRLGVTFRVRPDAVKLSVQDSGVADALAVKDADPAILSKVFDKNSPQPFTLELLVDRQTCTGVATLSTAGVKPQQLQFNMHSFLAQSGPTITAVGPVLATCCAPKAKLYAEVTHFQIARLLPGPPPGEPGIPNPPPINPH